MNSIRDKVSAIIDDVRENGDSALCRFAQSFDQVTLTPGELSLNSTELKRGAEAVSTAFRKALKECARQIEAFARAEKSRMTQSWMVTRGTTQLGQLLRPVDSVGLYIPGGRFPYPSTVLMTAIPARVAGVKRIVMATPPKNLTPEVLAAAEFAGVHAVYRVGGAGAIAALAYGTDAVEKVDFIVGPGNQYVTEAKRQVYGHVGIDSLAGPSEVVIIADKTTPPEYILNDLLAQAEHDPDARSLLLSTDAELLAKVDAGLDDAIRDRVQIKKVKNLNEAIEEANQSAAEHLELLIVNAKKFLPKIRHAGAIFLGPASTAVLGDYVAGPSHVLPTQRAARFSSGLSVASFYKRSSVIGFSAKKQEQALWEAAMTMADTEGMEFHGRSLRARVAQ